MDIPLEMGLQSRNGFRRTKWLAQFGTKLSMYSPLHWVANRMALRSQRDYFEIRLKLEGLLSVCKSEDLQVKSLPKSFKFFNDLVQQLASYSLQNPPTDFSSPFAKMNQEIIACSKVSAELLEYLEMVVKINNLDTTTYLMMDPKIRESLGLPPTGKGI
jgi:hypothetical protein